MELLGKCAFVLQIEVIAIIKSADIVTCRGFKSKHIVIYRIGIGKIRNQLYMVPNSSNALSKIKRRAIEILLTGSNDPAKRAASRQNVLWTRTFGSSAFNIHQEIFADYTHERHKANWKFCEGLLSV